MNVVQYTAFVRAVKRLHPSEKEAVKAAVRQIIADPAAGKLKIGDLAGVRVHKIKHNGQLKLLAYRHDHDTLALLNYGSHENFYRDLKT